MLIAITTSDEEKVWYEDIDLLIDALSALGRNAEKVTWDDPKINWSKYDLVFVDSTWDYTEKYQSFLQWCEYVASVSKLVNPLEVIQLSCNKAYLLTLQSKGLRIPKTCMLESKTPATSNELDRFDSKIVVKPLIGASGVDASIFPSLQAAFENSSFRILASKQAILVQRHIPEIQTLGEIGAIFVDGKLSHSVLKMPNGNDFRVQYQYGGATNLVDAPICAQHLYDEVVAALGVSPRYMRLDFIPTEAPIIMEVEMVEPHKFFTLCPQGAQTLAKALIE